MSDDWNVLPADPTEAMWQAGRAADAHPGDSYSAVYRAMAAAAPAPVLGDDPAVNGAVIAAVVSSLDEMIRNTANPAPTSMTDRRVLDWVHGRALALRAQLAGESLEPAASAAAPQP